MSAERAQQLIEAGIWLRLSGDTDGAKRLFEQALRLDPGNAKATELLRGPAEAAPAPKTSSDSQAINPFSRPLESPAAPSGMEADWGMATGFQSGIYRPETMPPIPAVPKVAPQIPAPVAAPRGPANVVLSGEALPGPPVRGTPPIYARGDEPGVDIDFEEPPDPVPVSSRSSKRIAPPVPAVPAGPPVPDSVDDLPPSTDSGHRSTNTMVFGSPVPQVTAPPPGASDEEVVVQYEEEPEGDLPVDVDVDVDLDDTAPSAPNPVVELDAPVEPPRSRASAILSQLSADLDMAAEEVNRGGAPQTKSSVPFRWPTPEPFPVAPNETTAAAAAALPPPGPPKGSAPSAPEPPGGSAWETRAEPAGIDLASAGATSGPLDLLSSDSRIQPAPSSPSEPGSNVEKLLSAARDLIELDDHTGAMELIVKAQAIRPDDPLAAQLRQRSEATLLTMYESKLGKHEGVPRVLLKDDEIIWLNLDHRAGFMLAQIDGTVSFEDLFAVSGMSRFDTARILAQLVDEGVISRG